LETESTIQTEVGSTAPKHRIIKDAAGYTWATGRRKKSVARVRVRPGTGTFVINGREMQEYFPNPEWQLTATAPLRVLDKMKDFDVVVTASGGGLTGQSGAVALGLARAIRDMDPSTYPALREAGLMTRDARIKERKKYGLRGARRAFQFSKR